MTIHSRAMSLASGLIKTRETDGDGFRCLPARAYNKRSGGLQNGKTKLESDLIV
jgi:hypothetical protein